MDAMFRPLRRYADFSGRARRKEFWLFALFVWVFLFVLMYLDSVLGLGGSATATSEVTESGASFSLDMTGGLLTAIFALAMLVPMLAVSVRRVHDQDKSGWFVLVPIYNIILMFLEGTRGPNRFGTDPKGNAQVFA